MNFTKIARKRVFIDVAAYLADGSVATLDTIFIALVPIRESPVSTTTWNLVTWDGHTASVVLCGSQAANQTGAVVIPDVGADLWIGVTDSDEVDAVLVSRINMR